MVESGYKVLTEALKLPAIDRAELVEKLLESFAPKERADIDQEWATEVEARIDQYNGGETDAFAADEVFNEIDKMQP